jgi:hypothetical protein
VPIGIFLLFGSTATLPRGGQQNNIAIIYPSALPLIEGITRCF